MLDSLGWVLYRMGRIPEALIHLRQAYELQPDPEVATHYGEVLWVSGQRDQARALWQKASERAPDNPLLLVAIGKPLLNQKQKIRMPVNHVFTVI